MEVDHYIDWQTAAAIAQEVQAEAQEIYRLATMVLCNAGAVGVRDSFVQEFVQSLTLGEDQIKQLSRSYLDRVSRLRANTSIMGVNDVNCEVS